MKINPKALLLLDGVGALLSAVLHRYVFPLYAVQMGLPVHVFKWLSFIAIAYALYTNFTYWFRPAKTQAGLYVMSILNILYAIVLVNLLFIYIESITSLGYLVLGIEIFIVLSLSRWEWITAKRMSWFS